MGDPSQRICATLVALALSVGGLAALEEPRIDLHVDAPQVAIGDTVELHIAYRWPRAWTPETEPDPGPLLASEAVVELRGPFARGSGEERRVEWVAELLLQESGVWSAPRPSLRFSGPAGTHTARAPEILLEVGTVGTPAELPAPRALWRPPTDAGESAPPTWVLVLGIGGVTALALGLWWWRRRISHETVLDPAAAFRDETSAVARCDDGKQAGVLLETALRRYCGRRFRFDGLGATGREVVARVGDAVPAPARSELRRLFEQFDALLWAPDALATATVQRMAEHAQRWVEAHEQRLAAERETASATRRGDAA